MAKMVYEDDAWHLSDRWDIDDVLSIIDCEEIKGAKNFTNDDCVKVLELVVSNFDANIGVNYEVIGEAITIIIKDKEKKPLKKKS